MQNAIAPESPNTPQTAVTEADAQAARLVTERLNEITRHAKRIERQFRLSAIIIGLVCAFSLVTMFVAAQSQNGQACVLALALCIADVIALYHAIRARLLKMPVFDAAQTARLGGVKAIPALFAALQSPLRDNYQQAIQSALTMLLPQMKASDAPLLTPAHRRMIHGWLTMRRVEIGIQSQHNALRLAALKALEQVGDSTSIPIVERLANRKARRYGEKKIKQAAIDCLPMLRANCGDVETARTLLRASQSEPADPDTLLRPASGSGQTGSAELLRGSGSPRSATAPPPGQE